MSSLQSRLAYQGARARAFGKRRGAPWIKAQIWNWEFRNGKWDHIESSADNPVYALVERYIGGGSVLDLACGAGAVRCDIRAGVISRYVGLDISDAAVRRARLRSAALKSFPLGERFIVGNMTDRATLADAGRDFDVVLFNECINYVAVEEVPGLLLDLGKSLSEEGVFIFRLHDRERWSKHVAAIRSTLRVIADNPSPTSPAIAIAAVPK